VLLQLFSEKCLGPFSSNYAETEKYEYVTRTRIPSSQQRPDGFPVPTIAPRNRGSKQFDLYLDNNLSQHIYSSGERKLANVTRKVADATERKLGGGTDSAYVANHFFPSFSGKPGAKTTCWAVFSELSFFR